MAKIIIELDTGSAADFAALQRFAGLEEANREAAGTLAEVQDDAGADQLADAQTAATIITPPTAPAATEEKRGRGRPRKTEPAAAPATPEQPGAVPPPPPANETPATPEQPAAAVPPPPPPAAPAAEVAPPAASTPRTMADLSGAITKGRITLAAVNEQAAAQGCADVLGLSANPAALAAVLAHFDTLGAFA